MNAEPSPQTATDRRASVGRRSRPSRGANPRRWAPTPTLLAFSLVALGLGCRSSDVGRSPGGSVEVTTETSALTDPGANLQLTVSTASCAANGVQDFFQVVNQGTTSVALSDITIKLWVNDTSAASLVAAINTGGCLNGSLGCFHQVTGVTATPTNFTPACGPDASHQADREITIATTDHTALAPGQTWANIQTGLHLSTFANFTPGTATWYSPCLTSGATFVADPHFAAYVRGNIVFASGINAPTCRAPQGRQKLSGYVPADQAAAPMVGPLPQTTVVRFSIGLPVQTPPGQPTLQDLAMQISNPSSASYRHYLTPTSFTATYAPTVPTFQSVVSWANTNGLTVDNPSSPSRMLVDLHSTVANVERALYINLVQRKRADGSLFFMPDRDPSLDLDMAVLQISGLDNFQLSPAAFGFGTGAQGDYLGRDFRAYYAGCSTNDGAGQRVGIFALDGFSVTDANAYAAADGLTHTPTLTTVTLDGFSGTPTGIADGEVDLDVQTVMGMAPGLDEIVVFEADPSADEKAHNDILDAMTTRTPLVNQISSSFVFSIDGNTQQLFNRMVSQGQAFFQASGDTGAYTANDNSDDLSRWGVTLVGGTHLQTTGLNQNGDPIQPVATEPAFSVSGGGLLRSTAIPDYQVGLDMSVNGGSTTFRNSPDLAACAWNTEKFTGGAAFQDSGTSVSTPLITGFMALANQQSQANGNPPIGFLNPVIYAIGRTPGLYAADFNDVMDGSNGGFNAVTGYDLVTGWGSPKCALIAQLGQPLPLPTTPVGLAAGDGHACAVRMDGSVRCWGRNDFGQLGVAASATPSGPVTVAGLPGFATKVVAGLAHTCARLTNGTVACWGSNQEGQLGQGNFGTISTPVIVQGPAGTTGPLSGVIDIAAGSVHTCATVIAQGAFCWGDNTFGQLGVTPTSGATAQSALPLAVTGLQSPAVSVIGAGSFHSCAELGTTSAQCWGNDDGGQLGGTPGAGTPIAPPFIAGGVVSLAGTSGSSCGLVSGGGVICSGQDGLLGNGDPEDDLPHPSPVDVHAVGGTGSLSGATVLTSGAGHSCVVLSDGSVACWGSNTSGQLGDGTKKDGLSPVATTGLAANASALAAGNGFTCAVLTDGSVACWGINTSGQLGTGTTAPQTGKVPVPL